jgi:hypothetical protein
MSEHCYHASIAHASVKLRIIGSRDAQVNLGAGKEPAGHQDNRQEVRVPGRGQRHQRQGGIAVRQPGLVDGTIRSDTGEQIIIPPIHLGSSALLKSLGGFQVHGRQDQGRDWARMRVIPIGEAVTRHLQAETGFGTTPKRR